MSRQCRPDTGPFPAARVLALVSTSGPSTGGSRPGPTGKPRWGEGAPEELVERGHAVVVEAGRHRAEDGELLRRGARVLPATRQLPADIAQRILAAPSLELVDGDRVGEVQHVDLFELRGGAELRRHDIERHVDVGHHLGVALPDTGCLHDHQVESGGPAGVHRVVQALGNFAARPPGGEGPEVHPAAGEPLRLAADVDRIHPDTVAQESPASLPAARVDGEDRHA